MYRNTHATVGQDGGQVLLYAPTTNTPVSPRLRRGTIWTSTGHHGATGGFPRQSRGLLHQLVFRRRAITLTEVLISLGILTIGLLGVATLFPVGSYYMRKGDIADRSSAIAQAAFNETMARGYLDPESWLVYEHRNSPQPDDWKSKKFLKPLVPQMQTRFAWAPTNPQYVDSGPVAQGVDEIPVNDVGQQQLNREFGAVYVIDPLSASSTAGAAQQEGWSIFPYVNQDGWDLLVQRSYLTHSRWNPWKLNSPMMRVTLLVPDPSGTQPYAAMTREAANKYFYSSDDLAIELPDNADRPAIQRWEVDASSGTPTPLMRQSKGDYSWIITVATPHVMARNALANPGSNSYYYQVSVVVFYKRTLDTIVDLYTSTTVEDSSPSELWTLGSVKSTGLSGGEVLLTANPGLSERPFDGLKSGEWLMLYGPHPQSTDLRPMLFANWYRITAIGKDIDPVDIPDDETIPRERRYVTLRGPQWPWRTTTGGGYSSSDISSNLCAVICPGAVAVHSKTLRLEGQSAWSIE